MKKYYLIAQSESELIYLGKFKSLSEAEKYVTPRRRRRSVILTKAELLSLARQSENSELKD
jgi:hypothetical protein